MTRGVRAIFTVPIVLVVLGSPVGCAGGRHDALPSWNEGQARESILRFVEDVTDPGSPGFVVQSERIAVFDNDGTLWSEQPAYFQLLFAMDRVRALSPEHPEWATTQPYKSVLEGDTRSLARQGKRGLLELIVSTHAGMTTGEFDETVRRWLRTARHPETGRLYSEMVFQPMLEVLGYLRANGFKTYIVSGGGIEFLRVFADELYGVPPEQVIGSSIKTEFEMTDAGPVLMRMPEIDFINDKKGKPIGIHKFIGRHPIAAFGNSDGDLQMLQWTGAGDGSRFMLIVHHTDAQREWAYDRDSHIGHLDVALDEARERGWIVVDMRRDWNRVYPW